MDLTQEEISGYQNRLPLQVEQSENPPAHPDNRNLLDTSRNDHQMVLNQSNQNIPTTYRNVVLGGIQVIQTRNSEIGYPGSLPVNQQMPASHTDRNQESGEENQVQSVNPTYMPTTVVSSPAVEHTTSVSESWILLLATGQDDKMSNTHTTTNLGGSIPWVHKTFCCRQPNKIFMQKFQEIQKQSSKFQTGTQFAVS